MCGIAGYVRPAGLHAAERLRAMTQALRHRGPDGGGEWTDPAAGVALGHTRLKVVDLTDAAHQPMVTSDGAMALVYNGEIYNFRELRDELIAAGATFRSTGDTAVLLELCRRDPRLTFLPRLSGMFAFAVWNAREGTLTLARDRTGVKPLLYAEGPDGIAFASEMRGLRPLLDADEPIDPLAVVQHLALGYCIAPNTIFRGVRRLPPGRLLRWRGGRSECVRWAPDPPAVPVTTDAREAAERLRAALRSAVATRLLADVPVGVFLSGGIDSSVVTAVAAQAAGPPVRTYSVSFPGQPFFDESAYARAVVERYHTDHTWLTLTLDDVRQAIPRVLDHLSEPFADSSALPTFLLSELTRRHVTVALSGDGADELFAGYRRYVAARLVRRLGWFACLPLYGPIRRAAERLPTRRETWLGSYISQLKRALRGLDSDPRRRYANWQRITDDGALAVLWNEAGMPPTVPAAAALLDRGVRLDALVERTLDQLWEQRGQPREDDDLNRHLLTEWRTSLPDDMLMKVDLASMAHGLEVRSPFLDNAVVELVQPLPSSLKLRGWRKKYLLIEAYRADLPGMLHNRPKKGFEVPIGPWLRGPLHSLARDLIDSDRLFFGTLLSRDGALRLLAEHVTGRADHNFTLWALLSLLAWQQRHAPQAAVG